MSVHYVIAVAGPSGAGKTTLVNILAEKLSAERLFFDSYPEVMVDGGDFVSWLEKGGDPPGIEKPGLVEAVRSAGAGYVVVEEPFGRSRPDLAALIDVSVVIDLPLELAMARRRARTLAIYYRDASPEEIEKYVEKDDLWIRDFGLKLYSRVQELAMASCDIRLDGHLEPGEMAEQAIGLLASLQFASPVPSKTPSRCE